MKQDMIGQQWHQLDHMQIICTSLDRCQELLSCCGKYPPDRSSSPKCG